MTHRKSTGLCATLLALCVLAGTGCRSTYYAVWEKMGKHKRDLLRENVEEARQDQAKASEQFKDALTRLKEMYAIEGGELEAQYDRLNADFKRCESRAEAVRERVSSVERVAGDLFQEWEAELARYSSPQLRAGSQRQLDGTRQKYQSLHSAMTRAERGMEPVLLQFRDHVLYLKHNLNARAISALKGETLDIEKEISTLIADMNKAISEADKFIQEL